MRSIQVSSWGQDPQFTAEAPTPTAPPAGSDLVQIKVIASGLHQLVRSQAAGQHYSIRNTPLPFTPGADGVGTTTDGTLVYFNSIATGGGFAEYINVSKRAIFTVPVAEGASADEKRETAITVASLLNPAMSSWVALKTRTTFSSLPPGFTVLVLGVTSMSGKISIALARQLGAGKIIGVARNEKAMESLGLDETIALKDPVTDTDFPSILMKTRVHVVLDYLYGDATKHFLESLPSSPLKAEDLETQYVQIGSLAGQEMALSSAVLRSKNITMRGSGPGSWSLAQLNAELPELINSLVKGIGKYPVKERGLEDAEEAWKDTKGRTVFVP